MILDTPISAIMTEDVFIIGAGDPVAEVASTFNNHGIRHAPVTSRGHLVGMLSWVDLKKLPAYDLLQGADGSELDVADAKVVVGDVMTRDPVSVQASDTLRDLAELLSENEFHAVPVLEGDRIVGIVSTTDLIRYFLEELSGQ